MPGLRGLYPKLMSVIGSVFLLTMVGVFAFVYISSSREITRRGLARAEELNQMAFEALYASMRQGGDHDDNLQVIRRLHSLNSLQSLRVIVGEPILRQYGDHPDALPRDAAERQALLGEHVREIRQENGARIIRYITPLRIEPECQQCHQAALGEVSGAIVAEISLAEYDVTVRWRRNVLLGMTGAGLLVIGLLTFLALRRLVIVPLHAVQEGVAVMAEGNLHHRLDIHTGDEIEALARQFNRMAQRLEESYSQLAEEQNKLLAAIEASHTPIWISDANRRMVMVNSALETLIGRSREELLGKPCRYLIGVRTHDGIPICDATCPFIHPTENGGKVEGCMPTACNRDAWVEITYGRVVDANGNLRGVIHIIHDLTERKEVEEMKEQFLSLVSHELRTPLHHIKGFTTTLLQTDVQWDPQTQRDFLRSIEREADRLIALVEKILHLSRLEMGRLPMDREWWQVSDIVDGALRRRRTLLQHHRVELDLAPDLPPLYIDGLEIEVVLMNLVENAVKYSDPGTTIRIRAAREGDAVVLSVEDEGIGIPPEDLDRIFERFYRVRRDRGHVTGIGLGLAICKHIVEAHGGRIWVESEQGRGTCFYVSLPLVQEEEVPQVETYPAHSLDRCEV